MHVCVCTCVRAGECCDSASHLTMCVCVCVCVCACVRVYVQATVVIQRPTSLPQRAGPSTCVGVGREGMWGEGEGRGNG